MSFIETDKKFYDWIIMKYIENKIKVELWVFVFGVLVLVLSISTGILIPMVS